MHFLKQIIELHLRKNPNYIVKTTSCTSYYFCPVYRHLENKPLETICKYIYIYVHVNSFKNIFKN